MQDIKRIITSISVEQSVTLVSVYSLPNSTDAIARLFTCLAASEINIDMISLTPSMATTQTVSFSAKDEDMTKVLTVIGEIKTGFTQVRTDVNAQNMKVTFEGDLIKNEHGVSAYVFSAFCKYGIDIKLITTSETSIACLTEESNSGKIVKMLDEVFGIKYI